MAEGIFGVYVSGSSKPRRPFVLRNVFVMRRSELQENSGATGCFICLPECRCCVSSVCCVLWRTAVADIYFVFSCLNQSDMKLKALF